MSKKLTRQGVPDLNVRTPRTHQHRHVPSTYITRNGSFNTQMRCYCGDVSIESDEERQARERAETHFDIHEERWMYR